MVHSTFKHLHFGLFAAGLVTSSAAIARPPIRSGLVVQYGQRCFSPMLQASADDDDLDTAFLDDLETDLQLVSRGRAGRARLRARSRGSGETRPRAGPLVPVSRTLRKLLDEVLISLEEYSERPSQQLVLGSLALLIGFFAAHGQAIGGGDQGGRWEYVSGGVAIFVIERVTRGYYALPMAQRSVTMRLLHAFKVGFVRDMRSLNHRVAAAMSR